MSSSAAEVSNTTFTAVADVENETAKAAMQASNLFGENVIHLVGQADHNMKSLNSTNVISGKILEVSFVYYSVHDLGHVIFMGCNGGNQTISGDNLVRETIDGNVKKITAKLLLSSYSGADVVNLYGGSASDEIYIGSMTAKLYDYIPPQEVVDKPSPTFPTKAQLEAEGGYTWDMVNAFVDFENSEYIDVSAMSDETIKAAIQGNSMFGDYVLRFAGGCMAEGVDTDLLTAGKVFTIDIDYYNVVDDWSLMITRGETDADNVTQPGSTWSKETVSGNFKHFRFSVLLTETMTKRANFLTTYFGSPNIYIGKVTIAITEPVAPEISFENHVATAEELAAGFTWIPGNENAHPGFDSCCETVDVSKIADASIKSALQGAGAQYAQHIVPSGGNAKFQGLNSSNVPNGKKLTVEIYYYAVTDFNHFLLNGGGTGDREVISGNLKKWSLTIASTASFDYVSIYEGGEGYVYKITALLEDNVTPEDETPNGHKEGDKIDIYSAGDSWVSTDKNGYVVSDYDNGIENLSSLEGMGTAPKRIDITNPSGVIEISQGHSTQLEIGVKYKIVVYFYNVDYDGNMYIYGDNNQFWQVPGFESQTGYHKFEYEITPTAVCNWLCLYSGTNTKSGTVYLGDIYVEVLAA